MTETDLNPAVVRALAQCHYPERYDEDPEGTVRAVSGNLIRGLGIRHRYEALLALWEQAQCEERARCREAAVAVASPYGSLVARSAVMEAIDNLPGPGA
jgi:hypothetical protein